MPIIEKIYHESNQIYGAGKVTAIMRERGIAVSESYVASIMHERSSLGKFHKKNSTHLTKGTLKSAIMDRNPSTGLIIHSDNGSNFTSYTFTTYLKEFGIKQSFSRTHNPYDNSVCESFFKNFKQEEIYRKDYSSEKEMLRYITRYMEFYNNERPHTIIRYKTPNRYEEDFYKKRNK